MKNKNNKITYLILNTIFLSIIISISSIGFTTEVTVIVGGKTVYQTMDGFGTTIRVFDDPHVFNNCNRATGRALMTIAETQENKILDIFIYCPRTIFMVNC